MRRRALLGLLITCVLAVAASPSRAADIEVDASVDRATVGIDEQIVLTVVVQGGLQSLPSPELPELPGFTAYSAGTSRNFSFVNGRLSSSAIFRCVLAPRNIGRFTIPPVAVKHGDTVYRSSPITVEVVQAAQKQAPAPQDAAPRPRGAGKELFLRVSVDKKEAYVNEQVTLLIRFYRRVPLLESPQYTPPVTTGFWVEDLPPQRDSQETIDGRPYYVTEIRQALFPTKAGDLPIGPATLVCQVRDEESLFGPGSDPFRFFGRGLLEGRKVTLKSEPVSVRVLPLPPNAPHGFGGAVGRYNLEASLDRAETTQNEPVTLTVTLSGEGNLQGIADPAVPEIPGVRAYDSGSSTDVSKEGYVVHGTRTSQRVLVPEAAGAVMIPAISLTYFDTKTRRYEEARTAPLRVSVRGGGGAGPGGRQGIAVTGRDVRYIETELGLIRRAGGRTGWGPVAVALQVVPLAGLAAAFLVRRHRERLGTDEAYARERRAPREVRRRLSAARASLEAGDARGSYDEIAHALLGFIAGRLHLPEAGLTARTAGEALEACGADAGIVKQAGDLLARCDLARFSPATPGRDEAASDLGRAEAILRALARAPWRAGRRVR